MSLSRGPLRRDQCAAESILPPALPKRIAHVWELPQALIARQGRGSMRDAPKVRASTAMKGRKHAALEQEPAATLLSRLESAGTEWHRSCKISVRQPYGKVNVRVSDSCSSNVLMANRAATRHSGSGADNRATERDHLCTCHPLPHLAASCSVWHQPPS